MRSLVRTVILQVHLPNGGKCRSGEPEQLLCPLALPLPHPAPVPWHSHQCRPCQMVQGVLEVQEGLVVQFLEGTGEK